MRQYLIVCLYKYFFLEQMWNWLIKIVFILQVLDEL